MSALLLYGSLLSEGCSGRLTRALRPLLRLRVLSDEKCDTCQFSLLVARNTGDYFGKKLVMLASVLLYASSHFFNPSYTTRLLSPCSPYRTLTSLPRKP